MVFAYQQMLMLTVETSVQLTLMIWKHAGFDVTVLCNYETMHFFITQLLTI